MMAGLEVVRSREVAGTILFLLLLLPIVFVDLSWPTCTPLPTPIHVGLLLYYVYIGLLSALVSNFILRAPIRSIGQVGKIGQTRWTVAASIGLVACVAGLAIAVAAAIPVVPSSGAESSFFTFVCAITLVGAIGAGEELLFRGFLLDRTVTLFGPGIGSLLLAGVFALAHAANPSASVLSALNLLIIGLFLSELRFLTGGLLAPMVFHATWNVVLLLLLGLPMSGFLARESLLSIELVGPDVLTGRSYGVEAGIAVTVIFGLATIILVRRRTARSR